MRVFDNNLNLNKFVLMYRAMDADPNIFVELYDTVPIPPAVNIHHYVRVDSILTDTQITNALATPQTTAEANAYALYVGARAAAKAIPSWATWTETEALAWEQTNIGARITTARTGLPATLTLTTARTAILGLITIFDNIQLLLVALVRLVVALRNKVF
jgi:hypothetical protein